VNVSVGSIFSVLRAPRPGADASAADFLQPGSEQVVDELATIAALMTGDLGYRFTPRAEEVFRVYLERRIARLWFANARSVRNALERAWLRHGRRLLLGVDPVVGREALTTFDEIDFRGGRVFAGGAAAVARNTAEGGSPGEEGR